MLIYSLQANNMESTIFTNHNCALHIILGRQIKIDIIKVFADNLKTYRKKRGISQERFAEMAGLHRTYISAVECYKRSISLANIQRIADALDVEPYELFINSKESDDGK